MIERAILKGKLCGEIFTLTDSKIRQYMLRGYGYTHFIWYVQGTYVLWNFIASCKIKCLGCDKYSLDLLRIINETF